MSSSGSAAPAGRRLAVPPRRPPPCHLADMAPGQRREVVVGLGQPAYRADQLAGHYFAQLCDPSDAATMTDLPARSRAHLVAALLPRLLTVVREVDCDGGATRKTLWRGFDGTFVESVLMTYPGRVTVCVSSQAGCGMGCPFCATGQVGLTRNLSAAEIVEQVVAAARAVARAEVPGCPARLSNVVFMGMGEPFANYRAVLGAVRRLTDPAPYGLGLAQRSITVSTVGLVPAIDRLADERLRLTLALSLHAPDDELRDTLVPVNTRWPVEEVLGAVRRYAGRTGRRVSIEYAMIDGVNDQPARADLLAERLHRVVGAWLAHVNLIPLNPTPHLNWSASSVNRQQQFVRRLQARGIATTVRGTRGREIAGACGQLMAAG